MSSSVTDREMLLGQFLDTYYGKANVGDTPANRGQCVGLSELWMDALGAPHVWGDAKDLLNNAPVDKYRIVHNLPTNYPQPGDIVVWGANWGGGAGHTGICVFAGVMRLTVYEQNDPDGSPPHLKVYPYGGILGWLSPLTTP
jgi:hypothetical protein